MTTNGKRNQQPDDAAIDRGDQEQIDCGGDAEAYWRMVTKYFDRSRDAQAGTEQDGQQERWQGIDSGA